MIFQHWALSANQWNRFHQHIPEDPNYQNTKWQSCTRDQDPLRPKSQEDYVGMKKWLWGSNQHIQQFVKVWTRNQFSRDGSWRSVWWRFEEDWLPGTLDKSWPRYDASKTCVNTSAAN